MTDEKRTGNDDALPNQRLYLVGINEPVASTHHILDLKIKPAELVSRMARDKTHS
jgi:hypothetical protein